MKPKAIVQIVHMSKLPLHFVTLGDYCIVTTIGGILHGWNNDDKRWYRKGEITGFYAVPRAKKVADENPDWEVEKVIT